jgi:hypothetical protein
MKGTDRCNVHTPGAHAGGAPAGNQNNTIHGFYRRRIPRRELDGIADFPPDLSDELEAVRVTLGKLIEIINDPGAEPFEAAERLEKFSPLVFSGARTIAKLTQQHGRSTFDDALDDAIDTILAESRRT